MRDDRNRQGLIVPPKWNTRRGSLDIQDQLPRLPDELLHLPALLDRLPGKVPVP